MECDNVVRRHFQLHHVQLGQRTLHSNGSNPFGVNCRLEFLNCSSECVHALFPRAALWQDASVWGECIHTHSNELSPVFMPADLFNALCWVVHIAPLIEIKLLKGHIG